MPVRSGPAQAFSEFVATFGLLAVIWGCARLRSSSAVPFAVAAIYPVFYSLWLYKRLEKAGLLERNDVPAAVP